MSPRLEGKVCVITGTGGSMGRASALAFAREGALVVGCDLFFYLTRAAWPHLKTSHGVVVDGKPGHHLIEKTKARRAA
jgi:hypothetical protein